jgi:hypothetical protein
VMRRECDTKTFAFPLDDLVRESRMRIWSLHYGRDAKRRSCPECSGPSKGPYMNDINPTRDISEPARNYPIVKCTGSDRSQCAVRDPNFAPR